MNKETRILKIQEVIDREPPIAKIEILWKESLVPYEVYQIPLEYLIYNKYNGRILSRTKSLERQHQLLNPETDEGKALIEKLLFESNILRNKRTEEDLGKYGQQKVGIITKDGIIIDGNRRAMLLNRIGKKYFKAVILPVTLEQDPIEIERLETTYQMGEDEKLGYNATEKYIKSKELYLKLSGLSEIDTADFEKASTAKSAIKEISKWMGETEGEVKKYLETVLIMDDYLEYLGYDGIYTQLDEREDQFLFLQKWLRNFYGGDSGRAFDGYNDGDVDILKATAFDYLRFRKEYDGKRFRLLAEGNRDNHLFGNREIWNGFQKRHFEIIQSLPLEEEIDYDSVNLEAHLNARDKKFYESAKNERGGNLFLDNLDDHEDRIKDKRDADEPGKLIKKAQQSLGSVNFQHKSFANPEIQNQVLELGEKAFDALQKRAPLRVLDYIIKLLTKFDPVGIEGGSKDSVEKKLGRIQKLTEDISKQIQ
jgi:hypothetical protein